MSAAPLPIVDLRSDTVTRPTAAMRAAMHAAEVGDDVYGEDPTVNALEAEVARLLGKETALFVPSGTMANQIALLLHARPGDSILAEEGAHCFLYEAGAAAALAGVQFDLVPRGEKLADAAIEARIRGDGLHDAPTAALVVENTHNRGGGRALPASEIARVVALAQRHGLRTHCDGARLWNAAAATGDSEAALAAGFDTVSVCFSKGLGAPVGSAIAGRAETVARARKLRKRLGGGMRQAGILAAAARHALAHHRARLIEDHRRAERLGRELGAIAVKGRALEVERPALATNMVYFRFPGIDGARIVAGLREDGVRVSDFGDGWLRAALHLEIDDTGVDRAIAALRRLGAAL